MMLHDLQQRLQAIDPGKSFIVQAPAGSGKTELLTQRYLKLLSTVNAPEEIIALTFTRKAASEMRERIFTALSRAADGKMPDSAHQQQTNQFNWLLLNQPSRLKIMTIDALCQTIAQAIPVSAKQVPYAAISEQPFILYEQAARACLAHALNETALHEPLSLLLQHLDNRQDILITLLTELLAIREQWLTPLYTIKEQGKEACEKALAAIETHELERFLAAVSPDLLAEVQVLACQMVSVENNPDSPRYALINWHKENEIDSTIAAGLAALLLTSDNKLRKGFDHHVGLKIGACDKPIYEQLKKHSKELLAALNDLPDFCQALMRIKNLPTPHYDHEQWQVLQALLTLLPLLAAHLQLIFHENNQLDFTAVTEQALQALGDEDNPTDLTLYFDNAIHHILVDEFQDTSIQQYNLLGKLIQGWLPDEGKTLFIVGDPMQSIYRFRQAEVGLFLKAKHYGIGQIKLHYLQLTTNFRSAPLIVNWVNDHFKTIFPAVEDIEAGAVSYSSATAALTDADNCKIAAVYCHNKRQEAEAIAAIINEELTARPLQQLAVLVRSRNQLTALIPLLREKNIPFQGVEIDKLAHLPHLQDAWTLTKALLMPADRLSWLALLRSPWCGLSLADILLLANVDAAKSIYHALANVQQIPNFSEEGKIRAHYVFTVLQQALIVRHQQPLSDWVRQTMQHLHSDLILLQPHKADLEQFWLLLDRYSKDGLITDFKQFEQDFDKLYAKQLSTARLQIMTIHKAKGLEFDTVILPGLGSKSKNQAKPLLRWLKLPARQQELLLLSPIKAAHHQQCRLYDYIGAIAAEKDWYEQQRLLYVAVTRAKTRLYLLDYQEKVNKGSLRQLLTRQEFIAANNRPIAADNRSSLPILTRLPLSFYLQPPSIFYAGNSGIVLLPASNARQYGIIAHELLQWIGSHHPEDHSKIPWLMFESRFKNAGFADDDRQQALQQLQLQIIALFNDPIGKWLISKHEDEHNEYALLVQENGHTTTRIIDRTFCENGTRWIIDFKTGQPDVDSQYVHQQQVNHYAKLIQANSPLPIKCGIYYLATNHWVNWDYQPIELSARVC